MNSGFLLTYSFIQISIEVLRAKDSNLSLQAHQMTNAPTWQARAFVILQFCSIVLTCAHKLPFFINLRSYMRRINYGIGLQHKIFNFHCLGGCIIRIDS